MKSFLEMITLEVITLVPAAAATGYSVGQWFNGSAILSTIIAMLYAVAMIMLIKKEPKSKK